eukprot:TRINITY_DN6507_c0_g1_i2.p2 TRINITY_DN6507_c0_g1~~TRINITY_DN6507_c0_g1_i2.p2  ORF type:complete len:155 (-),score=45.40 TRINITY_DN6507_c0_g1_i2:12-476(-)
MCIRDSNSTLQNDHSIAQDDLSQQKAENEELRARLTETKRNLSESHKDEKELNGLVKRLREELREIEKVHKAEEKRVEELRHQLLSTKHELEIEKKAKEQKDRHLAVMLHEKEKLWRQVEHLNGKKALPQRLSLIHICRCRRYAVCRSRWSPYH